VALNKENYNYKDPKQVPNLTVDGNLVVGGSSTAGSTSSGSSGTSVGGGAVAQTTEPTNPTAGLVWVNTAGNAIGSQLLRWRKASAGGSSTLTGADDYGTILQYTPGYEHVYVNGILLVRALDYVGTTGSSIALNQALASGDVVEVFNVIINGVTNTYTTAQSDAKYASTTSANTLTTSLANITPLTIKGIAGQTADVLAVQNAVGSNLTRVDINGNLVAGTSVSAPTVSGTTIQSSGNLVAGSTGAGFVQAGSFGPLANSNLVLAANSSGTSGGTSIIEWSYPGDATWGGGIHYITDNRGASGQHIFWHWNGSSWTQDMYINPNGTVIKPSMPFFAVGLSSGSYGSGATVLYNVIYDNNGSYYNSSTGKFTAPVAGRYFFRFHQLNQNGATGDLRMAIVKNGSTVNGANYIIYKGSAYWQTQQGSITCTLAAGDAVWMINSQDSSTLYLDSGYNSFQGYLIG
jgi:C1q domain